MYNASPGIENRPPKSTHRAHFQSHAAYQRHQKPMQRLGSRENVRYQPCPSTGTDQSRGGPSGSATMLIAPHRSPWSVCLLGLAGAVRLASLWRRRCSSGQPQLLLGHQRVPPPFGVNCHSFIPFLGTAQRRWTRSLRWRLTWLCNVSSLESLGFPRTRIKSYRRHRNAKRDFPSSFPSAIAPVCLLFTQWLAQLPRLLFP